VLGVGGKPVRRHGQIAVINFDRMELRNLSTQPYHWANVGALKAEMLGEYNLQKLSRSPGMVIAVFGAAGGESGLGGVGAALMHLRLGGAAMPR